MRIRYIKTKNKPDFCFCCGKTLDKKMFEMNLGSYGATFEFCRSCLRSLIRKALKALGPGCPDWHIFRKTKPTADGWYTCTVEVPHQQRFVMDLYWYGDRRKFIDNIRQSVCETYTVTGFDGKRLYDIGQDRTSSVVAWKKKEGPYMTGFVYRSLEDELKQRGAGK